MSDPLKKSVSPGAKQATSHTHILHTHEKQTLECSWKLWVCWLILTCHQFQILQGSYLVRTVSFWWNTVESELARLKGVKQLFIPSLDRRDNRVPLSDIGLTVGEERRHADLAEMSEAVSVPSKQVFPVSFHRSMNFSAAESEQSIIMARDPSYCSTDRACLSSPHQLWQCIPVLTCRILCCSSLGYTLCLVNGHHPSTACSPCYSSSCSVLLSPYLQHQVAVPVLDLY